MELPVVVVVGMAGSGKTRFTQRLISWLHSQEHVPFAVNLDPAVHDVPYSTDVDIRDTLNYKQVMEDHGLGPNGAIMTCLNLFAAQFDKVLEELASFEKVKAPEKYAVIDTPGQIEIFTWSASGSIITETLAATYSTVMVYVVDTTKCQHPSTFMANMLYACTILYRTQLPLVLVFNKIDETRHEPIMEWITDYETFQTAIYSETSFMASFVNSLSLVLEEFYSTLQVVGVSSLTGENMDLVIEAVRKSRCSPRRSTSHESLERLVQDISLE